MLNPVTGLATSAIRIPVRRGLALAETSVEDRVRKETFHRVSLSWLAIGLIGTLLLISACRRGAPIIDTSPPPPTVDGTISGTVRGPEGTSPIEGRTVAVINVDTGERQQTTTNNAGGFTFKVKPGKYRVELTLRQGEMLVKRPGVINVNRSDVDAHADFVVSSTRTSRPRFAAPRIHDGLGPPSA